MVVQGWVGVRSTSRRSMLSARFCELRLGEGAKRDLGPPGFGKLREGLALAASVPGWGAKHEFDSRRRFLC
jgi:hypothetical protein